MAASASGNSTWPKSKSSSKSYNSTDNNPHQTVLGKKRGSTGAVEDSSNITFKEHQQQAAYDYLRFPNYLSAMQGRGRFQVSSSDIRLQTSPLNIQHACRLQQQLMAEFPDEDDDRKVVLGICAMAKKSSSKPMNEIIRRLVDNFDRLQVLVFDEDTILNKPVEEWPIVNGLVSFFSHGFPLDKAIAYKNLRNPFIVNDLEMQYILQDRRKVYSMMKENNIPHPRYAVLDRENDPDCQVIETEDSIEFNGNLFMKPFVEKPVDAEDHNIYIYFPQAAGGGSTRLFRKIKDRSSVYLRFCRVRSKGSYLYEDFMPTDGTDVKVYTVGPDYQHAEARKSPALDGKVERDKEGKEIRYPVLLANREKMIARNVCKTFKQNVCGFDLLRANGQHYVCDVNGFSFVKTSSKYYDDCAKILGTLVMRACCPQLQIPYPMSSAPEDIPVVQTTSGSMMELRSVIAVIRHGDRTPKQKMKMEVKNKKFFQLFEKYGGFPTGHLKLKKPKQLQEVLDIVRDLLAEGQSNADPEVEEKRNKLNQLKLVLEMYGHFSGINRKVQLKYQPMGRPKRSSSDEDEAPRDPSLLLILKWGGELTSAGRIQAENLGKAFRTLYPGGQGQFEAPGLGFLRLHSTFRHDLKIYASDEGRVQMTAAAFTKGLLALEGQLTPILVQMVKSANTNGLLDGESVTSKYQMVVKEKLKDMFNEDRDFTGEDHKKLAATDSMSLVNAMEFVKNPFKMCRRVHEMIKEITARIRCLKVDLKSRNLTLFNGESWELLMRRWAKLEKDFVLKNGRYDISKIPDIYDCIKYDLHHNQATLQFERAQELFMCSKALADIVIPQEYGITSEERLHIGQNYCMPLMRKIRCDLLQCATEPQDESATRLDSKYSKGVASPERFVRTRLYFTSESHIHSMLSMLRYGGFLDEEKDEQWKRAMDFMGACAELNYMSQIVIMMFEDPAQDINSDDRFHVELHFSPGAYTSCDQVGNPPKGMGFRPKLHRESTNETSSSCAVAENPEECLMSPDMEENGDNLFPLPHRSSVTELEEIIEKEFATVVSMDRSMSRENPSSSGSAKKSKFSNHPRSPDPETPEWDWGDDDDDDDNDEDDVDDSNKDHNGFDNINKDSDGDTRHVELVDEEIKTSEKPPSSASAPVSPEISTQNTSGLAFSLPGCDSDPVWKQRKQHHRHKSVPIESSCTCKGSVENLSFSLPKSVELLLRKEGSMNLAESLMEEDITPDLEVASNSSNPKTDPIQIAGSSATELTRQTSEDKRSRSLEDGCCNVSCKQASVFQRNYKTIHLPLSRDLIFKPLASFLFFNNTPKGNANVLGSGNRLNPPQASGLGLTVSTSSPDFSRLGSLFLKEAALEGFNNVPLLHPLETLHNNLTFHQVDDFLGRVTTQRFPVPDISALNTLACKVPLNPPIKVSDQLPPSISSNSSSGGPNSPTSSNTPVDLLTTLGMYIGNCHQSSQDGDQAGSGSSQNGNGAADQSNNSSASVSSEDTKKDEKGNPNKIDWLPMMSSSSLESSLEILSLPNSWT